MPIHPDDVRHLERMLELRRKDLQSSLDKVKATKILLSLFEAEVRKAEEDIKFCSEFYAFAPIRRLPAELLSRIFVTASIGDVCDLMQPSKSRKPICQVLVHVSKYWRDLAFQTREIWQHRILLHGPIGLSRAGNPQTNLPPETDYVRCTQRLLGVVDLYKGHLTQFDLCNTKSVAGMQPIHDTVIGLKDQITSLSLYGTAEEAYVTNLDMPQLGRLLIQGIPYVDTHAQPAFFHTPKLRKLFVWARTCISIPKISSYRGTKSNISPSVPPTVVGPRICALRRCSVMTAPHGEVTLPCLKVLEIHNHTYGVAITPFPHIGDSEDLWHRAFPFNLLTPALEVFDLAFAAGNYKSTTYTPQYRGRIQAIGQFLRRAPSLSQVRILISCFKRFPGIQPSKNSPSSASSRGILRFSGGRDVFTTARTANRESINSGEGQTLAQYSTLLKGPTADMLRHEIGMDRYFDRYVEGTEVTQGDAVAKPPRISYDAVGIEAVDAVFELLSDDGVSIVFDLDARLSKSSTCSAIRTSTRLYMGKPSTWLASHKDHVPHPNLVQRRHQAFQRPAVWIINEKPRAIASMDLPTLKAMSRANAFRHPVECNAVEHVEGELRRRVASLHEAVWERMAEECQRELESLSSSSRLTLATRIDGTSLQLWAQIDELKAGIEWCRALYNPSPVRALPPELLSHIFTFVGIDDSYDVINPRISGIPAALSLVHVSKFWRDMALQTKELWTHPVIVNRYAAEAKYPFISEYRAERCVKRLAGVIDLYGTNLTHVSLHLKHFPWGMWPLADMIIERRHQLISLNLFGSSRMVHSLPFDFDMPLLQTLSIPSLTSKHEKRQGGSRTWRTIFNTPRLKEVFLFIDSKTTEDMDGLQIPWYQITHLSVGKPYTCALESAYERFLLRKLIPVLLQGRNLVYLHLTGLVPQGPPVTGRVNLPRLRVLEIHDRGLRLLLSASNGSSEETKYFPFTIEAPALETFDLICSKEPTPSDMDHWQPTSNLSTRECTLLFQTLRTFLQNSMLLSQVRIMVCTPAEYLGQTWNGTTNLPSGRLAAGAIYRIAGDSETFVLVKDNFKKLSSLPTSLWAEEDNLTVIASQADKLRYREMLTGELWMNRFIDRCMEECLEERPEYRIERTHGYPAALINSILDLFGGSIGLPTCDKELYLAP
ncbi:hypothetical protein NMY22_g13328 [Coprinellus aureogranulatus]|nr:hypothetical protein NMY22_g13328 [Coprinellus aureogranulatus]